VIHGRRRLGKTRLLLEWARKHGGLYTVYAAWGGVPRYWELATGSSRRSSVQTSVPGSRSWSWIRSVPCTASRTGCSSRKSRPRSRPVPFSMPWVQAPIVFPRSPAEWDIVAESRNGKRILLGEAKWSERPIAASELKRLLGALAKKSPPDIAAVRSKKVVRALFVPRATSVAVGDEQDGIVVTASDLFGG